MIITVDEAILHGKDIEGWIKHNKKRYMSCHTHKNFMEVYVIFDGKVTYHSNNKEVLIDQPSIVLVREKDVHYFERYQKNTCSMLLLIVRVDVFERLCNYLYTPDETKQLLDENKVIITTLKTMERYKIYDDYLYGGNRLDAYMKEDERELKTLLCYIMSILSLTAENERLGNEETMVMPKWFELMIAPVNHYTIVKDGIKGLVDVSGKSNAYLCKVFKKYKGITPSSYINYLRIMYAKELLLDTEKSIATVASDCGYENLSHFYHRFKENVGIAPKEYRNSHIEEYF